MQTRVLALLNAIVLAVGCAVFLTPSQTLAQDSSATATAATQDVLHMRDGRVLKGKILNETRLLYIFEYTDPVLKSVAKLTLAKDDVALVERDIEVKVEPVADETRPAVPTKSNATPATAASYGTRRIESDSADATTFYIIPMKGQMGTDINSEIYRQIVADVKAHKPDVVVVQMMCQDTEDVLYSEKTSAEAGYVEYDEYRALVNIFRNDLREFRQVVWVEDSVGISSMVAMAWDEIYMKPTARFGGLGVARSGMFQIPDLDVRGKMVAALMGMIKSFLEYGKYSLVLADAMVQPELALSASWKGREVTWTLDDKGEYLVDGNNRATANFRARDAENLCLSKGTAESLDDLALLLGYREYRVLDGAAVKMCEDYVTNWRRAYGEIRTLYMDYQQYMGWATGEDTIKYLGRAITTLEKVLTYLNRFKPLEMRLMQEFGITKSQLTVQIEMLKEQLRALRRGGGGMPAGGGGGGGTNPGRG